MAKKFSDYIIPGLFEAATFGGLIHAFTQDPINWGNVASNISWYRIYYLEE